MRTSKYGARQLIAQARKNRVQSKSVTAQAAVWAMGLAQSNITKERMKSLINERFWGIKAELNRYKSLVRSLVAIAPLLGLLGTVDGMIETFNALGDMALFTQTGGIAGGISRALFTTQMGLAISIPGIMLGRVIDRKQRHIGIELDQIRDQVCVSKG
jgi:biopolymer transport protein ExbB